MKTLITLCMLLVAGTVSAQVRAPGHYSAQFEITDISESCPKNAMCITNHQIATVKATIGCSDQIVYKNFEVVTEGNQNIIHATSLVRRGFKSNVTPCVASKVITEKVMVWNWGTITLINSELE